MVRLLIWILCCGKYDSIPVPNFRQVFYREGVRFCMPAQWTGELIGEIHNAGFKIKEVANEANLNPKYVSQILHGRCESSKAETRLREALERLKLRR